MCANPTPVFMTNYSYAPTTKAVNLIDHGFLPFDMKGRCKHGSVSYVFPVTVAPSSTEAKASPHTVLAINFLPAAC